MTCLLYLLRHGEAAGGGNDHDRMLTAAGRRAAGTVGRWLTATGESPDRVLSSGAQRARRTAELAMDAGGWDAPLVVTDALYLTGPGEVLGVVARQGADADGLLVVGHEPTWSGLVGGLTGATVAMPTATVACVEVFAGRWDEVADGAVGQLRWLVPAALLERSGGVA